MAEDIAKLCETVPPDLADLIKKYPEIFPDDLPAGLPPSRPEDHRIELEPGAQPTVQRQFRLSQPELEELQQQLDYLMTKGFIWPSTSPYAALVLFTPKKDGGFRMCIDYRALNRITIKSRYPIPRADELLDQLHGAKFFSKINLQGGYHQIRIAADDCHNTAFRTRYGSYEYLVMPFGLTNAPSTVQMTMNDIFRELLDKCVIIYLDDCRVFWVSSTTITLHTTATGHYFNKRDTSRIWVPGYDLLRTLLIQESHDNPTSGNFGVDKTIKTLQRNYYLPNMADDVRNYVSSCTACQIMKSSHQRAAGLLQPLDPPELPWQHITMDYVTGLPAGQSGNDAILMVIDRLTKMAHFIACQQSIIAEQTAQLFIANVIRLHGLPTAIISDRDPKFTSNSAPPVGPIRHQTTLFLRLPSTHRRADRTSQPNYGATHSDYLY
ncbi:hypothetical protein CLOP_g10624 [Closterium sp. NIES-67]|nr:hypothetical protein CLOP_g10624 [Closterium sp. NIES-67]